MYLDRIVATKRSEAEKLKAELSIPDAERTIADMPPCRGFKRAISTNRNRETGLIAEVKKASPSKGLIRPDFDPVEIAKDYMKAQADCLSVLTDRDYFQGGNEYLRQVRETVQAPILRKDFTIDPLQIYEARLIGADAILLIAAILTKRQLQQFSLLGSDLGLDVLVEVHDRAELEMALEIGAGMIGINNRNLKTFVTDLRTTEELIAHIPHDAVIVSESGISKPEEIVRLRNSGAHAVLVGEHFMRQADVSAAVVELMGPRLSKGR